MSSQVETVALDIRSRGLPREKCRSCSAAIDLKDEPAMRAFGVCAGCLDGVSGRLSEGAPVPFLAGGGR